MEEQNAATSRRSGPEDIKLLPAVLGPALPASSITGFARS